jgi:hypothetical protein
MGGVELLCDRNERHPVVVEGLHDLREIEQRPAEVVDLVCERQAAWRGESQSSAFCGSNRPRRTQPIPHFMPFRCGEIFVPRGSLFSARQFHEAFPRFCNCLVAAFATIRHLSDASCSNNMCGVFLLLAIIVRTDSSSSTASFANCSSESARFIAMSDLVREHSLKISRSMIDDGSFLFIAISADKSDLFSRISIHVCSLASSEIALLRTSLSSCSKIASYSSVDVIMLKTTQVPPRNNQPCRSFVLPCDKIAKSIRVCNPLQPFSCFFEYLKCRTAMPGVIHGPPKSIGF